MSKIVKQTAALAASLVMLMAPVQAARAEETTDYSAPVLPILNESSEVIDALLNPAPEICTVTFCNQSGALIATAEVEQGASLNAEAFPKLENVGWYICGEDGAATETPAKPGLTIDQPMSFKAVDRVVELSIRGEYDALYIGCNATLTANLTGFINEQIETVWQACPTDGAGNYVGEWTDVAVGGTEYTYRISDENKNLAWRLVVNVQ